MQDLVADDPVVAQADDGLALGVEDRGPDLEVVEPLLLGLVSRPFGVRPDVARLVLEPAAQLVDQLAVSGVLGLEVVQPPERRLDRGQAGMGVLRVRAGRGDDAEPPDEPGAGSAPDRRAWRG